MSKSPQFKAVFDGSNPQFMAVFILSTAASLSSTEVCTGSLTVTKARFFGGAPSLSITSAASGSSTINRAMLYPVIKPSIKRITLVNSIKKIT